MVLGIVVKQGVPAQAATYYCYANMFSYKIVIYEYEETYDITTALKEVYSTSIPSKQVNDDSIDIINYTFERDQEYYIIFFPTWDEGYGSNSYYQYDVEDAGLSGSAYQETLASGGKVS